MAIRFLNTKYNRTLESLSEISYTEGANGSITAYVPFSATSFDAERTYADVDLYGRQWCSIDGMQQYGINESIYILRIRIKKYKLYDSFQSANRTAVISGLFGTKNENMSFPFEFKLVQIGCRASEPVDGDIVFWKLSGSTDSFNRIETGSGWRGNNYCTRVIGSNEVVESKLNIRNCANLSGFYSGQNLLTSITTESCDFSGVISFSNMFYNCQQLEDVDVSDWDFNGANNLEAMFSGCMALTGVTFPSITAQNCTNISSLFMNCTSLVNVDITGIQTENVTTMANMFSNCSSLTTVDVSEMSTLKCTNMVNMFNGCASLTQIDIRNWDVSVCSNFSGIFNRCQSLTNIIGGETEICGAMAMVGANKSFDISTTNLDLPSMVAIFLGVARLEEGSTTYIRMTRMQSEIARDYLSVVQSKNWKISVV